MPVGDLGMLATTRWCEDIVTSNMCTCNYDSEIYGCQIILKRENTIDGCLCKNRAMSRQVHPYYATT